MINVCGTINVELIGKKRVLNQDIKELLLYHSNCDYPAIPIFFVTFHLPFRLISMVLLLPKNC